MRRLPIFVYLLMACLMPFASSCSEKADDEIPPLVSGFFTAHSGKDGIIDYVIDDFGKRYEITKSRNLAPNTITRVVCTLELDDTDPLKEPRGRITSLLYPMSNEAPSDIQLHDSLKTKDPVKIVSSYIGGGYLNVHLEIMVSKEDAYHSLNYCRRTSYPNPTFKIYHNAHGDSPVYTKKAYLSIPLSSASKNDTICLKAYGADQKKYEIKHVYK